MLNRIDCLIIDDEQLARTGVENFVKKIPFLNLVNSCNNIFQLEEKLAKQKVDLLFLDIQMPGMSGIDFLRRNSSAPITIITSAYSEYALQSFEFDVIDYLVKPIPFERFLKAVNKAKDFFELKQKKINEENSEADYFFIKCEKQFEKVFFNEIVFVEALENYVIIQTDKKKFITYVTFKSVEDYLSKKQFIKIHKSYIISLPKIEQIRGNEIKIGALSFPIGRSYKKEVFSIVLKN